MSNMRGVFVAVALLVAVCTVAAVPVYVMLPLDTIHNDGKLDGSLGGKLDQLKGTGVDGVMTDVWWGIAEASGPSKYDFSGYRDLVDLVKGKGMKLQAVMSFHQCGGNVGDRCDIKLPQWALSAGKDYMYTDREGKISSEYISLFADGESIQGRTPVQIYADFVAAFASEFSSELGSTIDTFQIGLGPAGELRYPSYSMERGWSFPGVGEFQCYDKFALKSLAAAATAAGHADWGHGGPDDAGTYNTNVNDAPYFNSNSGNSFKSDYGKFFNKWYSDSLVAHGDRVLAAVRAKMSGVKGVRLAAKVSGIHWLYNTESHAAELTAGYYNTDGNNAYKNIAGMLSKYITDLDFTCLEMRDSEQSNCQCSPEALVAEVKAATSAARVAMSGENALPRYDQTAFDEILRQTVAGGSKLKAFTYLRLCQDLLNNLGPFGGFVKSMHSLETMSRVFKLFRGYEVLI